MGSRFIVNGILVVDKPEGLSSNHCLQRAKRLLAADKAGHTGSLDPLACGVLPLCFGEATKVAQYLLDADKTYHTIVKLGVRTASGDRDGAILATREVPHFTEDQLQQVLSRLRGVIVQQPSIYSALKQNGVPLYKLARAGKEVEPKFREVHIYQLDLLRWQHPELELRVRCSKGTYIRTLADDLGEALGTGGHVIHLRREQAGPFMLQQSVTLEQLEALVCNDPAAIGSHLLPVDMPLSHLPAVELDAAGATALRQGKSLAVNAMHPALVRVYSNTEFVGIGEVRNDGRLYPKRLLSY
jgi:tRNA pseudouridine55 synthase